MGCPGEKFLVATLSETTVLACACSPRRMWYKSRVWVEPCTGDWEGQKTLDSFRETPLNEHPNRLFPPVSYHQASVCPAIIILWEDPSYFEIKSSCPGPLLHPAFCIVPTPVLSIPAMPKNRKTVLWQSCPRSIQVGHSPLRHNGAPWSARTHRVQSCLCYPLFRSSKGALVIQRAPILRGIARSHYH